MSQCKQRKARRLDRKKAVEQHKRGLSNAEIASLQGVAESTVWRFLERTKPQQEALERFKSGRPDELANLQGKALDVQHLALDRIREDLSDDGISRTLSPSQKSGYLTAATIAGGTAFDKERLERGESTQNISVLSRMMDQQVATLYQRKADGTTAANEPTPGVRGHESGG